MTLDEIQSRVAAVYQQNEDSEDISTRDYSLRTKYINMAQTEWARTYDWRSLYRENNSLISTSTGNASVALPTDFKKLAAEPMITYDGVTTYAFPEIRPQEARSYDASHLHVTTLGDDNVGKTMVINAGTIASGASVMIPYFASPASLISPADIVMCPNPDFLTQRTLAYLWEAQGDPRFRQAKLEADQVLNNLLEQEQVYGEAYMDKVWTTERKNFSFRWGKS